MVMAILRAVVLLVAIIVITDGNTLAATDQPSQPHPPCSTVLMTGPAGPSGVQGPQGLTGPAGNPGIPGVPGQVGVAGVKGDQGQGSPGQIGSQGQKGDIGLQGLTGTRGPPGKSGPQGSVGVGVKGQSGVNGQSGAKGQKGEQAEPFVPPASPMSAFSARRTTILRFTSGSQTITFDTEDLDFGDDFNPSTGIFTCRVAGLYYFSFNLFRYSTDTLDVYLKVNGNNKARMNVYSDDTSEVNSQSVILNLQPGDEVKLVASGNVWIGGNLGNFNIFNGYLIYAIN